jgi:ABC-2 type transport system ATP-binding protein
VSRAVEAIGLSRAFGPTQALAGFDLNVDAGEMVALLGPDGAGKTTAMRLLAGVIRADSGVARLAGIDVLQHPEAARALLGYVPQRFSLYGELTVWENLQFLAEVRGLAGQAWRDRAEEMLRFVGLEAFRERRARALSGGMKQKLGLAAALIHQPQVLLLDEPTGGVDPLARQGFWRLLVHLLREGAAILISTPYMDEAARCGRVGFLHQGRLLVEGTPAMLRRPLQERMIEVTGAPPGRIATWAADLGGIEESQVFGATLRLRVRPGLGASVISSVELAARRAGAPDVRARLVAPSLEDVFRHLLPTASQGQVA